MLFLFGWGKKAKKIGYFGVSKCGNCKNYTHSFIYEISNNINIYFVPVAKFNKKYILSCELCHAGIEITPTFKDNLLTQLCPLMAPPDETMRIWNLLYNKFQKLITEYLMDSIEETSLIDVDNTQQLQDSIIKIIIEVKQTTIYKSCVDIIWKSVFKSLADYDMPN